MRYDLFRTEGPDAGKAIGTGLSLEEAADCLMLDEADIEWAIEEYGRCDGLTDGDLGAVVVEAGTPYPGGWVPD